jgi:hypothetical protein
MTLKALAFASLLIAANVQEQTFALREKHVVGRETTYETKLSIEAPMLNLEVRMTSKNKTTKVEEDGAYEEEYTDLGGTTKFNGEESPVEASEPKVYKYNKDGDRIDKEDDDDDEGNPLTPVIEMISKTDPKNPVKIGESWDSRTTYGKFKATLVGREKYKEIECLKIEIKGEFTKEGLSGKGSAMLLLREKDFTVVKATAEANEAVLSEGMPPSNVKFSLIEKQLAD